MCCDCVCVCLAIMKLDFYCVPLCVCACVHVFVSCVSRCDVLCSTLMNLRNRDVCPRVFILAKSVFSSSCLHYADLKLLLTLYLNYDLPSFSDYLVLSPSGTCGLFSFFFLFFFITLLLRFGRLRGVDPGAH